MGYITIVANFFKTNIKMLLGYDRVSPANQYLRTQDDALKSADRGRYSLIPLVALTPLDNKNKFCVMLEQMNYEGEGFL